MKVKKFIATTMPEAMQQIRTELGTEAVILQSKKIKQGGFLGFFQKSKFEVIAALDPQPVSRKQEQDLNLQSEKKVKDSITTSSNSHEKDIISEIKHLKKMLEQQSLSDDDLFKPDYQIVYNYLLTQEVERDLAKDIINSVVEKHNLNEQSPHISEIVSHTEREIEQRLGLLSFEGMTYSSRIIHFIGPTGVGKTTTLAKLAARSMLLDKKKVAFITTDTYRIAAIEQLKTYARILDVPVEVAYSIEDYQDAIEKFSHVDLIFVDTAGRNFRHENYVQELTNQIQAYDRVEALLVMSLTAKAQDIVHIYEQFSHLSQKKVIFTKVDETRQYGSMLNIALQHNIDIAYLTDGQDVPDDLIEPSAKLISNYIMSEYDDK
ncbi:MAG TPA: flagellar biosynthesis protein FlhF [Virgibacillus sp.]|nr:flagellar biosynthesis protein FlhF [Virgibacillus sp.]